MDTTIEFLVKGKDMLSGMFPPISKKAGSTFMGINNDINKTQQQLNKLGNPVKIKVDTSEVKSAGNMFGSVLGGSLAASFVTKAAAMAKNTAIDSINAAMNFGMQKQSFSVLTGSAARGGELAAQLRDLKQSTIVGAGVYQNAQTMMGFGIDDKSVLRKLREVGDIGMGNQDKQAALALARSQTFAAGKLMGQDLLQYINAGFNPLSVMAEKWKEFGFTSKKTIGQLKELMGDGKISSEMVDKAFELATSKGGKFYKMMESIGDTPGGKMLKMKGNWAALQIDMGNALMPIASSFMEVTGDMLHFINISKSVPETLMGEKMEINSLLTSITHLNEGNAVRLRMLDMLKAKFPDMFSNIDAEKIKNSELLSILNNVNGAYDKRIALATNKMVANVANTELNDNIALASKLRAEAAYITKYGKEGGILGVVDRYKAGVLMSGSTTNPKSFVTPYLQAANRLDNLRPGLNANEITSKQDVRFDEIFELIEKAKDLSISPTQQKELWGPNTNKNHALLESQLSNIFKMQGKNVNSLLQKYDWTVLERLMQPKADANGNMGSAINTAAGSITGGGQKVINVNIKNIVENMYNEGKSGEQIMDNMKENFAIMLSEVLKSIPS